MKIQKLNEDKLPMQDPKHPEKSAASKLRVELGNFVEDCLYDALDNMAMIAASQVEGYNADWCEQEGSGANSTSYRLAIQQLVSAVSDMLLAYQPK